MRAYYIKRYCLADYLRGFFVSKAAEKEMLSCKKIKHTPSKKPANNRIGSKARDTGAFDGAFFPVRRFFRIPAFLPFLDLEVKNVVITIAAFIFGPLSGAAISVCVALVEMFTISTTGWLGFIMNAIASLCFVCPAAFFTKKAHHVGRRAGACYWLPAYDRRDAFVELPDYAFYMNVSREAIAALLLPAFLPFNLVKTGLNTALILLLYKPVVLGLRKANLIPQNPSGDKPRSKVSIGILIAAGLLLATCVLVVLVVNGTL